MNWVPSFAAWQFALAGLLAAFGPLVIHLLSRRRQRRVPWAATELLMRAVQESRRSVQVRDLLLLVLRCLSIALFGIALAQPYFVEAQPFHPSRQPHELVLLIDNSLSMSYATDAGSRLDVAKTFARELIDDSASGSRYRVVPLCGQASRFRVENSPIREEALVAVANIDTVDRSLTSSLVLEAARNACQQPSALPRRIILLTDLQKHSWEDPIAGSPPGGLPSIQVMNVASDQWTNSWVAEVGVQDDVAEAGAESLIRVRIGSHGIGDRQIEVQVSVDGALVASRMVEITAGDEVREISFPYRFSTPGLDWGQVHWSQVAATISADRLRRDDHRFQMVPVVAGLPAVFVDQLGDRENIDNEQLGETLPLRRILGIDSTSPDSARVGPFGRSRHLRIDELNERELAQTRVVVVAGVADPTGAVSHLRQFVERGGQLIIAAGGEFVPELWNAAAWDGGDGILPAALHSELIGSPAGTDPSPFTIDFESLAEDWFFRLGEMNDGSLRMLYAEPLFFQAIRPITPETSETNDGADGEVKVLARFTDPLRTPFLVERQVGLGRVLLITSGLRSRWNTLAKTNAVLILDRAVRRMLRSTFAVRNYQSAEKLRIALPQSTRDARARLLRPGRQDAPEPLEVSFVSGDRLGVIVDRPMERGWYQIEVRDDELPASPQRHKRQTLRFAVNGPAQESVLEQLDLTQRSELRDQTQIQFVDTTTLASQPGRWLGELWWWLVALVLVTLFAEMALAAESAKLR